MNNKKIHVDVKNNTVMCNTLEQGIVCNSWWFENMNGVTIKRCYYGYECPFIDDPSIICGMHTVSDTSNVTEEKKDEF